MFALAHAYNTHAYTQKGKLSQMLCEMFPNLATKIKPAKIGPILILTDQFENFTLKYFIRSLQFTHTFICNQIILVDETDKKKV